MSPCLCCIRPKVAPDLDDLPKVGPPPRAVEPPIQLLGETETRQLGTPSSGSTHSSISVPFLNIFEEASYHLAKLKKAADLSPDLEPIVTETSKKLEALHKAHADVEVLHDIQSSLLKVHNSMQALQPNIQEAAAKKRSKDPLQAALDRVLKNVAKELEKARTATDQALAATNTATRDSLRVSIVQMSNVLEPIPPSRRASELAKSLSAPSSRRATEASRQPSKAALDPLLADVAETLTDIAIEASEIEHDAKVTKSRLESTAKELLTDFVAEARQSLSEAQVEDSVINADPVIEASLADPADPIADEEPAPGPAEDPDPVPGPAEDPVDPVEDPVPDPVNEPQANGDRTPRADSPTLPPTEDDGTTTNQPRLSIDTGLH
ncbi:hypothetical protein RB599_009288 [Gaeumannomyces hyphopodioides]